MATALKPRSEMDPRYLWRLEDIFPTDEAAEKEMEALSALVPQIAAILPKVDSIMDNLNRADVTVLFYDKRFQNVADAIRDVRDGAAS